MSDPRREPNPFQWHRIGDIRAGRPHLGPTTRIEVYRLFLYSLRDELAGAYGARTASDILVRAGLRAGSAFCRNLLDTALPINAFLAQLQDKLKTLGIGIMRVEVADLERMRFVLTVAEDLDCSGLPVSGETVCDYDEGFLAGIFGTYTGRPFEVTEVDCWASGGRVCRFEASAGDPGKEVP